MTDKEIIKQSTDRYKLASEAEQKIREEALEDLKFRAGDQWPEQVKAARDLDRRPCLTINMLPQYIKQITNEQRQNKPQIQVNAVSGGASEETAEIIQGMTRHIEVASNADVAYDTAFDHAVTMGFGYFRLLTDYEDDDSFDQVLKVERIRNPFMVYFDPSCNQPDYSDGKWCHVVEDLTEDEYKEKHPKSTLAASLENFTSTGDQPQGWLSKNSVRVAEYIYIECETKTLCKLADGSTAYFDELPEGAQIITKRDAEKRTVKWCLHNAVEILDSRELVWTKHIPIIPVLGDEIDIDGEKQLVGVVRYARDPQRNYNYWASSQTEMIALAPRAPFVGARGQFEGFENQWKQANVRNLAYLEYNPTTSSGGQALPSPQRQVYEPPVQAIGEAREVTRGDLQATVGMYNAALGAPGPEQSGKAVLARQKEGSQANLNFSDNLARSIRHLGNMIVYAIPFIYDAERRIRIIGGDQQPKQITINAPHVDESGAEKMYDVTRGKYSVSVSVGPSYESQRQEAVESILALIQANPEIAQFVGDVLVGNMDWPGAQEIADRLRQMLPPALQPNGAQAQQQQAQQAMQQNQDLQQKLAQAMQVIQTKQLELDSKERQVNLQEMTKLIVAEITAKNQQGQALLGAEMDAIKQRMNMLHENIQLGAQNDHELQMHDQQTQAAQELQANQPQPASNNSQG